MELRQPSREVIRLSQEIFASRKPNQTTQTTHTSNHLKLLHERASAKQVAVLPLALTGLHITSLHTQWSYLQPSTRSSLSWASGHGLCWGSRPAKHRARSLADLPLAAQESPGSGSPGKLNTLQPVVDLAIDKMIQNLASSKESFIIGYSCQNLIYWEKAAIKLPLLVKGSFCFLIIMSWMKG